MKILDLNSWSRHTPHMTISTLFEANYYWCSWLVFLGLIRSSWTKFMCKTSWKMSTASSRLHNTPKDRFTMDLLFKKLYVRLIRWRKKWAVFVIPLEKLRRRSSIWKGSYMFNVVGPVRWRKKWTVYAVQHGELRIGSSV